MIIYWRFPYLTDISKTAVQILHGVQKQNSVNVSRHLFLRTIQRTTGVTSDQTGTEFDLIIRTLLYPNIWIKFPFIKISNFLTLKFRNKVPEFSLPFILWLCICHINLYKFIWRGKSPCHYCLLFCIPTCNMLHVSDYLRQIFWYSKSMISYL